jgi:hypothetical protein
MAKMSMTKNRNGTGTEPERNRNGTVNSKTRNGTNPELYD